MRIVSYCKRWVNTVNKTRWMSLVGTNNSLISCSFSGRWVTAIIHGTNNYGLSHRKLGICCRRSLRGRNSMATNYIFPKLIKLKYINVSKWVLLYSFFLFTYRWQSYLSHLFLSLIDKSESTLYSIRIIAVSRREGERQKTTTSPGSKNFKTRLNGFLHLPHENSHRKRAFVRVKSMEVVLRNMSVKISFWSRN